MNQPQSAPRLPEAAVNGNTVLSEAEVGGVNVDLSMNSLFTMLQDLKVKKDVLTK